MISIIICSKYNKLNENLLSNIKKTIGSIAYEIVLIDNSKNSYSICQAYNIGISKAKYAILCFMHEDIIFRCNNWGKIVVDLFKKKPDFGLCGVIGTDYISKFPCGWWHSSRIIGSVLHNINNKKNRIGITNDNSCPLIQEVIAVDGLWFCIPKYIFNNISFDEMHFKNFHCYDIDICLQILSKKYKIIVINNIHIEHKSAGNLNEDFYSDYFLFKEKWNNFLPIYLDSNKEKLERLNNQSDHLVYNSFKSENRLNLLERRKSFKIYQKIIKLFRIKN